MLLSAPRRSGVVCADGSDSSVPLQAAKPSPTIGERERAAHQQGMTSPPRAPISPVQDPLFVAGWESLPIRPRPCIEQDGSEPDGSDLHSDAAVPPAQMMLPGLLRICPACGEHEGAPTRTTWCTFGPVGQAA